MSEAEKIIYSMYKVSKHYNRKVDYRRHFTVVFLRSQNRRVGIEWIGEKHAIADYGGHRRRIRGDH